MRLTILSLMLCGAALAQFTPPSGGGGGGGGGSPTGAAGGSLTGTYPNPGVVGFTSGATDPATCTPNVTLDNWNKTSSSWKYCSATNNWSAGRSVIGSLSIGTMVLDPTAGIKGPIIACVGTPGNTTGPYGSLCEVRATGALWGCTNAAGCTVAADWTGAGTTVSVNGSAVASPNFNATTPAATAGYINVTPQVSSSSVSLEVLPSALGAANALSTCTTAATVDPANGATQTVLLTAANACAITITQPSTGTALIRLRIKQASTPTATATWAACVLGTSGTCWPSGIAPVITASAGAYDWVSCLLDGTNAFCTAAQNFQ